MNVTGGTLQGAGTFSGNVSLGNASGAAATFIIGDPPNKAGLLSITGNYAQLATGAMDVQIGGTTAGTQFSQLNVTGAASLTGTLNIARINSFTPTVGQTFTILTSSAFTGTFSTVTGTSINSTEHFSVSYTSTSVILTVVSGPAPPRSHMPADSNPLAGAFIPTGHRATGAQSSFLDHSPIEHPDRVAVLPHGLAPKNHSANDWQARLSDHNPSQSGKADFSRRPAQRWTARFGDHNPQQPATSRALVPQSHLVPQTRVLVSNPLRIAK